MPRNRRPAARAAARGRPFDATNNNSPALKRYVCTMIFAIMGATFAIWISNLENNAIEKATEKSAVKPVKKHEESLKQLQQANQLRGKTDAGGTSIIATKKQTTKPENWKDASEKKEGLKTFGRKPDKRKQIAVIGERNSGTRWINSQLQRCFPAVRTTSRLTRWKHWFQDDVDEKEHEPTLVIAAFRNPYEWAESLRKVPHQAPMHVDLEWKEFLTKEWSMPRPKRDEKMMDSKGRNCTEYYHYWEVISCVRGTRLDPDFKEMSKKNRKIIFVNGHLPFYELKRDGSGKPYKSVLDLRRDKIKNFLSVKDWEWVTDVIPVSYEKMVGEGTDFLLRDIEKRLGVERACKETPPQARLHNPLTQEYLQYIDDHVDWDAEALVGYTKGNYANLTVVTTKKEKEDSDKKDEKTQKDEKSNEDNSPKEESKGEDTKSEVKSSDDASEKKAKDTDKNAALKKDGDTEKTATSKKDDDSDKADTKEEEKTWDDEKNDEDKKSKDSTPDEVDTERV